MDATRDDSRPGFEAQLHAFAYQGLPTFARRPLLTEPDELDRRKPDVAVVGAPWDDSTTYRAGARFGPRALRCQVASAGSGFQLDAGMSLYDHLDVVDYGDAICSPGMAEASHQAIEQRVGEVACRGIVPIVLGGDHSVTWPAATAVARHHGFGRVGMVHFDAHADADDIIAGNRASHGTPMRRLIESGAISGSDFLQIGLRGYWPCDETLTWMRGQGMRAHTMTEIWERGCREVLQDVIDWARRGPDAFYLSVDVDVLDPGFAPGTGTPEPGGMTSIDLLQSVRRVARQVNIVGMDVVELSPPYDQSDVTTHIALRVIFEALVSMAQRKRERQEVGGVEVS